MDAKRKRLYGLTWPSGHFLRYDLGRRELRDLGPIPGQIPGADRAICRSLAVNPEDGSVSGARGGAVSLPLSHRSNHGTCKSSGATLASGP